MTDIDQAARVLVAVITRPRDLLAVREQGWYRIPMAHAPRALHAEYLALYQTAAFGAERWAVRYFAPVQSVSVAARAALLPDEPRHPRAGERYYRFALGPLQMLPFVVPSQRLRRITFIATTYGELLRARDVADLWRPAEDMSEGWDAIWGAGVNWRGD